MILLLIGLTLGFVYTIRSIRYTPARTDISINYISKQGDFKDYKEDATCEYIKSVSFRRIEDCLGIKCPMAIVERLGKCYGLIDGREMEIRCVKEKYYVTSNITELDKFDSKKVYLYCSGEDAERNIATVTFKYNLPEWRCYDRTLMILNSDMEIVDKTEDAICPII